jgi:hypothetical protein
MGNTIAIHPKMAIIALKYQALDEKSDVRDSGWWGGGEGKRAREEVERGREPVRRRRGKIDSKESFGCS